LAARRFLRHPLKSACWEQDAGSFAPDYSPFDLRVVGALPAERNEDSLPLEPPCDKGVLDRVWVASPVEVQILLGEFQGAWTYRTRDSGLSVTVLKKTRKTTVTFHHSRSLEMPSSFLFRQRTCCCSDEGLPPPTHNSNCLGHVSSIYIKPGPKRYY